MNIFQRIANWFKALFSSKPKETKQPVMMEFPLATCGAMIADEDEHKAFEAKLKKAKPLKRKSVDDVYVVPVFFHIIHKGEPIGTGTNISDAQIYSAVSDLNDAFAKAPGSNGDGNGVETPLRFVLANKDDQGNPTNGISRFNGAAASSTYADHGIRSNNQKQGESESVVKSWSRQNNQHVYNIWIVSEIDGNNGGSGVQGFAYFPTTSMVDGIVQLYNATGITPKNWNSSMGSSFNLKSYTNLNKTLTHEMGHAFGLFHTFQGNSCTEVNCAMQGDRVCDTPPTIMNSNGNYPACGGTQQVENYMDYTNQVFKNMFTAGQRDRCVLTYENSRNAFMTSTALDNLATIQTTATMRIISPRKVICSNSNALLEIQVNNTGNEVIHKMVIAYTIANTTYQYKWFGAIAPLGDYNWKTIGLTKLDINTSQTIEVEIISINDNPSSVTDSIEVIVPTNQPYRIDIVRDVLMGQISWDIVKADNLEPVYESPAYENFKAGQFISHEICLPDGDYIFTLTDIIEGMQTPGSYLKLIDNKGNVLVHASDSPRFSEIQYNFTVGAKKVGDVNNDGFVNLLDVSILSQHFNSTRGDSRYNELVDLNNDGFVNIQDLSIMLKDFNNETEKKTDK